MVLIHLSCNTKKDEDRWMKPNLIQYKNSRERNKGKTKQKSNTPAIPALRRLRQED
jgi:hypothetical protein